MDTVRPCGCKGRRSCLICEKEYAITPVTYVTPEQKKQGYVYCSGCEKAFPGWDIDPHNSCPNHSDTGIEVNGIYVLRDFISETEKEKLLNGISKETWDPSQSGRRKQNYGPKCNFKKNKIQIGNFNGFPNFSKFVQDKFNTVPILKDFNTIEQCSLEYDPSKGASIDPHIDDCWIWGERIVTVNVLGDTFLTLTRFKGDESKYNLNKVKSYPKIVDDNGLLLPHNNKEPFLINLNKNNDLDIVLRVFMPEKSLIVMYGSARYEWEHFVLREDIKSLRICLAYREFTPPYLSGGEKENVGGDILNISKNFW